MLLIYRHETRVKTGYIVTEDMIDYEKNSRYKPAKMSHPEMLRANTVMRAMSDVFLSTSRERRLPLLEAFNKAVALQPEIAQYAKYLSKTPACAERILIKGN